MLIVDLADPAAIIIPAPGWADAEVVRAEGKLERQDMVWVPMFQKPLITVWHDDRLTGPIGTYTPSSLGGFFNMYDWALK